MLKTTACFFLFALALLADVSLPALFSDGMVLQRDRPCRIWGKASPLEEVTVTLHAQTVTVRASELGRWSAWLSPEPAGGPYTLTASAQNRIEIGNVVFGEVWVASGQSNMVWSVAQSNNKDREVASSNFPAIRFFKVANVVSPVPLDDMKGSWKEAAPRNTGEFSAAGYFFARHLYEKHGVAVGVIQTAWGGTPAEAWVSLSGLAADPSLISVYADWAQVLENFPAAQARYEMELRAFELGSRQAKPNPPPGPNHQHSPSGLYNAMIAPITPYAIRGAIWYQGENNAGRGRSYIYRRLMPALIADWRRAWGQGDFPFLFVQLANYAKVQPEAEWPELREAQMLTLGTANTGMAVAIDIGESQDIHPKNKQDVGLRLALAARALAYGEKIVYSGPLCRQVSREGLSMRLWFDHSGGGLIAKGGELKGFEIAGPNKKFVAAQAKIEGSSVVVSSAEIKEPAFVRYAWANDPECNLFNAEGLPASPFRTDDWEEPRRYR